ncbi:MAG: UDP-N-acetylmuramoyl-L-alanyl-D-glutamate--2,6-diaminopimelate ligase [Acidimicrobiia bacterium]|nr:MAG: UDP-N-acetylmuramoyl-L-alanyl-D-glutamate--2,6-diaminopimelate ligase [Acidimicrobiia bacterium]
MPDEPITLDRLATIGRGTVIGDAGTVVGDVTHDSRAAGPDDLFVAIRGAHRDGHEFVTSTSAGAACVDAPLEVPIPLLVVPDTRAALPWLAAEVHGHPSRRLQVVGVTGTNGKTTVAHMVAAIVEAAGQSAGVIGTIGARIGPDRIHLERTSPEASDFQRLLRRMVDAGVGTAAVEVSSHALEFGRVDATEYAVVAFTNLSQDHLDLHGDMESYFLTKASLFLGTDAAAVVNVDDPWGARLVTMLDRPVVAVGTDGDYRVEDLDLGLTESRFVLSTPSGREHVRIPLGGRFNVENALVAAACAGSLGLEVADMAAGLGAVELIPGRMEPVDVGQQPAILVDYAHTPEGIDQVLESVRPHTAGRITVVVGAGGDRDADKRSDMGRAATRADRVVFTSDNPRSEDPGAIIEALLAGADGPAEILVEPDRRLAIERAIREAGPGDVVLILGKGHEPGQEIAGRVLPFDDRQVAREAVTAR